MTMTSSLRLNALRLLGTALRRRNNRLLCSHGTRSQFQSFHSPFMSTAVHCNVIRSPYPDVNVDAIANTRLPHYVISEFRKYSEQPALVDGLTGRSITYGQLETLISRVTSSLVRRQLVTKLSHVTLFSSNSIEFVVVYLGVTLAGCTVSPVNPQYTVGELVYAVNLVQSTLIIADEKLISIAKQAMKQCPSVKNLVALGSTGYDTSNCHQYSSLLTGDVTSFVGNIDVNTQNDLLSLSFSSGTTGFPKAVMLTHHNIVSNILQARSPYTFNISPGMENIIAVLPFYHSYGQVAVMLTGLSSGAKIVILPKFEPVSYLEAIVKHQATFLFVVPPILMFLAQHHLVPEYDFSSVHTMITAAAPISTDTMLKAVERCRNQRLVVRQAYGLTETGPLSHCNPPDHPKLHTVGPSVPNTNFKIVDTETGKSLGMGEKGEICIRGPQVTKGYYMNQQATDNALRDGWFHTGDSGHFDEDLHLIVEDRIKELIKVKGFQVAPAELEAMLAMHVAVQEAAVIGRPDEVSGELPTAFVVLKQNHVATEPELQTFIEDRLAPHKKLTGGVVFCREIPKLPSGKILRRVLRDELAKLTRYK